eukprot:m.54847 g.54847  ORF g.54847 m.54847 type:complete len:124 (-) comp48811_c0_seq6:123-494(-)
MLRGVPFILALLVVLGLTALASGWVYNPTGQTCDQVCEGKGFCREFALDAVNTKEEVDAIGIELSLSSCVRKAIFANLLTNQEATCLDEMEGKSLCCCSESCSAQGASTTQSNPSTTAGPPPT